MGLKLSNAQIGQELGLDVDSAHDMATQLRNGILAKEPAVVLSGQSSTPTNTTSTLV